MAVPVIGISSYLERAKSGVWDAQAVFLPWAYAAPVVAAGGAVSVLPPQPLTPDAVAGVLSSIDGLYLAGGYDVDPAAYGAEPHPETDETLIPKFREPGNLKFVVAGGTAGRFSAVIPGWTFPKGSRMIWRKIHTPEETS